LVHGTKEVRESERELHLNSSETSRLKDIG
jgi:hypothetical protein